ncbi:MAG: hypothetical protein QW275_00805 [Candidatus Anstonellaceae archaeon]
MGTSNGAFKQWKLFAAAAIVFVLAFVLASPKSSQQEGQITILAHPENAIEGENISIRGFSSCGNFSLYIDGSAVLQNQQSVELEIKLGRGEHIILASNKDCFANVSVSVAVRECKEGETRPCMQDGCEGKEICEKGLFSPCTLPPKICIPGQKLGCLLDECRFGYMVCNQCGSGFGPCLPKEQQTQSSCQGDCN